jgi:outer membrane protein TolC
MSALMLAAVLAAAPIRLEDARSRSRENTQAMTAILNSYAAEQDVRVARSSLLPQVGFRGGATWIYSGPQRFFTVVETDTGFEQTTVDVPGGPNSNYNLTLSLSQLLYDRAVWARLGQSKAQFEAQRGEAKEQQDASELEGIQRFFALFRTQATIQVLLKNVERSEQQLERARALFQAGRVGKSEELSALVNLGNDRIAVVERRGQLAMDQAQLSTWLALPGATPLEAVDPGTLAHAAPPVPDLEQALNEAKARRPLLEALKQRVRVAELQRSISQAGYLPRVSAQAAYQRSGPSADAVFTEPQLQNSVNGGLNLQWDIFNGFSTQAQSRRAEYLTRVAELNLSQSERELEGAVRQSHEALQSQIAAAELSEANRKAAADSLALATERYNAGVSSTLEVRDAQLKLTQSELSLLENRIDVEVARFALMRAMGTLAPGEAK